MSKSILPDYLLSHYDHGKILEMYKLMQNDLPEYVDRMASLQNLFAHFTVWNIKLYTILVCDVGPKLLEDEEFEKSGHPWHQDLGDLMKEDLQPEGKKGSSKGGKNAK